MLMDRSQSNDHVVDDDLPESSPLMSASKEAEGTKVGDRGNEVMSGCQEPQQGGVEGMTGGKQQGETKIRGREKRWREVWPNEGGGKNSSLERC